MDISNALLAFDALGQPSRLAVFRLLVQTAPDGLPAGDIARQLDLRPNTLSTHLAQLQSAKLIAPTRHGRSIRYSADMAGVRGLLSWLLQDCCGGSPEICAPVLDRIACAC
jgi:ArsR family transcriptional regulator, arsenate/arsenite/antimonite-responsive transcriptional repressor